MASSDLSLPEVIGIGIAMAIGVIILLLCLGGIIGYIQVMLMIQKIPNKNPADSNSTLEDV